MKTGSTYQATSNTICTGTDGSSGTADQRLSSTPAFGWLCYIPEINGTVVPFCGGSKSFRKTGGWLPPTGRYTKRLRYSIARESADTTLLSALSKEHTDVPLSLTPRSMRGRRWRYSGRTRTSGGVWLTARTSCAFVNGGRRSRYHSIGILSRLRVNSCFGRWASGS